MIPSLSMDFDIVFFPQVNEFYSGAACVQMLTQTEDSQQDIYFRMLRIMQSIKPSDCQNKSRFISLDGAVVGKKEKLACLFEATLNTYRKDSLIWRVDIGHRMDVFPAIALLNPRNCQQSPMLEGHPVIISNISKDRITICDPINEEPVDILRNRIAPIVVSYFPISRSPSTDVFSIA